MKEKQESKKSDPRGDLSKEAVRGNEQEPRVLVRVAVGREQRRTSRPQRTVHKQLHRAHRQVTVAVAY